MGFLITGFFLAYMAVLLLIPPARALAIKHGFVDEPGGRKDHAAPVPPIGGLVIFGVYMLSVVLTSADLMVTLAAFWPLFTGLFLVLLVGALDDYKHMNPWLKFSAQFAAAFLIVIPGGAELKHLGNLFGLGNFNLGFMSMPFSVIATVLLINAINLMDGLDGLAAGKSFVIFLWMAIACAFAHEWGALQPLLPLMGALAAFLFYNMRHPLRSKANVFLGDAGSMALGLIIAWFAIALAKGPHPPLVPISMAWILALPIMDTCAQFNRRAREGRHPFSADRGHFHHHLVHAGLPVGRATAVILGLAFLLGLIGYGGVMIGIPQLVLTIMWIVLLFAHMALSLRPQIYISLFEAFKAK
ncbi:MAG: undecaprenyl/decaprenyl-phosphate alpha-N-acetylglucosaminyl 1-phosphate transferase [Alphaproteobacteria bacterium]|nr:undecaprenyl/decaprenyl-phosphate alpha-N-acetylglucosaminyl 1-phosphate transferase [Alphaproteobacteria bacterium]